ncbi:DUF937 domain-containing protein [Comamonas testosteroni]|uniref:DUF937 domain-containing protein n=1 Tax=Comamonas testosteroni TaxID=285 RepID=A0A373FRI2_COMTE|nr:YidB family protein [Comamonas testosteroni]RGE46781.1 DUF937 domain-containing protein [Comamonas testosteroni]
MLDTLIRDVGTRLGLGDQAQPLVEMVTGLIANPATGGLSGFLDKFRNAGLGSMVQSWLGSSSTPEVPTHEQLESVLGEGENTGGGLLSRVASSLGLPYGKAATAVAALIPMLVSRMTPRGTVPATLPAEFGDLLQGGLSRLGVGGAGAAISAAAASVVSGATSAASTTAAGVSNAASGVSNAARSASASAASAAQALPDSSGGIGKWLPWLIGALVVIFGISYCSKNKSADAPPPAPTATPAPAPAPTPAPEPAPAPAPAAATPAAAPEGAAVVDGAEQGVPTLRVFFDSGKTDVAAEFAGKSKALVDYLAANADAKAVISGFNDPTGDPAKNAELSKQRAQAVQSALVAAGVAADRTLLEKPADTTPDAAASNAAARRVDVTVRK